MLVVVKIIGVAFSTLAARCSEVGGAADAGRIGHIVAVGAGACLPGRNGAVDLICADKWCSGGVVATRTVLSCRSGALIDQHACGVVVGVALEVGIGGVACPAVATTSRNGGYVSSGCVIS